MELKVLGFIKQHPEDWKALLTAKPFCLAVKENDKYVLLKYDQIESDFKEPIVKECRGLILRKSDLKPVCVPFYKFFNYGETHADKIDWKTAKVQQKVDGSIIKVWYDEAWHISTNGTIDANEATCPTGQRFADLFYAAYANSHTGTFENFCKGLNENYTYMFEMVHHLTRIVIRYDKPMIYHIGTRDNRTLEELHIDCLGVPKPMQYSFNSIEDAVAMAQTLPYSEEGYVVVDGNWNRVKVKSPSYVAVHHLKNNGVVTYKRIIELVMKNETKEFLSYFPEFTDYFMKTEEAYSKFLARVKEDLHTIAGIVYLTRKDYALTVTKMACPDFMFKIYDSKFHGTDEDFKKYLFASGAEKIVKILGLKDERADDKKTVIEV
jgi:hypothetical protein